MAAFELCNIFRSQCTRCFSPSIQKGPATNVVLRVSQQRLQSTTSKPSNLAFVFDIDGVLVRGKTALPNAAKSLSTLRERSIPFILLTNGGGYPERERAEFLSKELEVQINTEEIIQSHTPFQDMHDHKDGNALIVGGEYANARSVAEKYGFKNPLTPSDIYMMAPSIWPFSRPLLPYHEIQSHRPLAPIDPSNLSKSLKIDSIFVYNDPRDWGLDLAIIIDLLLSHRGYLGTLSGKNGLSNLPNRGYQQDDQPSLMFSNPDLWFAADFALPRLGQGAFRAAIEGVWKDVTQGAELQHHVFGKPYQATYEFAERRLQQMGSSKGTTASLNHVYMVGDNPASDIRGAMGYKSPSGVNWHGALVRTGVYTGGELSVQPSVYVEDVWEAVQWGLAQSGD